jgi:flagellar basal-body rod modification protein FlgD
MPQMGRPTKASNDRYSQVTINKQHNVRNDQRKTKKILDKITGYSEESVINTNRKDKSQMGKDEFLKLLTFQLQNQDPMNPMEQSKFTAELAQFSQLEQLSNLNKKYDDANKNAGVQDKFFAASFLGKQIVTRGSTLKVDESGDSSNIYFDLKGDAKTVIVRIMDGKGGMVGEINAENMMSGAQTLKWDGIALDGYAVKPGNYQMQILAYDHLNDPVPAESSAVGLVESVTFDGAEPVFFVAGKKVSLRDVKSFHVAQKDLSMHNKVKKTVMPKGQAINQFTNNKKSVYD